MCQGFGGAIKFPGLEKRELFRETRTEKNKKKNHGGATFFDTPKVLGYTKQTIISRHLYRKLEKTICANGSVH